MVELTEVLPQPYGLGDRIGNGTVLVLGARAGDGGLPLGRPGEKVAAEEDAVPRCGFARVGAADSIRI